VSFLSEAAVIATMGEVIDATTWPEIVGLLPPGTRDKVWIYDSETQRRALFKEPKADTCEHVCERVTADIARAIGLPVPDVHYARRGEALGTVIYSFLGDGERLVHGGEIFAGQYDGFDPWDYKSHTYQRLRKIMILPAISLRVHEMLLFDALVGNVDRHVNNWGFVSNSFQYFAPIFDNGSTLIARCDEEKCGHVLRDRPQFDGLVRNCDSRIYWDCGDRCEKLRHFDFVRRLIRDYAKDVRSVEGRFKTISSAQLTACLDEVPEDWLGPTQLKVAAQLIETRHQCLLEALA
jgi:hypothetical protein